MVKTITKNHVRVEWLATNGADVVTFGDQLLSFGGRFFFPYRWQLEAALKAQGLKVVDFEGSGIIETIKNQNGI